MQNATQTQVYIVQVLGIGDNESAWEICSTWTSLHFAQRNVKIIESCGLNARIVAMPLLATDDGHSKEQPKGQVNTLEAEGIVARIVTLPLLTDEA